jgi:hypothetical protein
MPTGDVQFGDCLHGEFHFARVLVGQFLAQRIHERRRDVLHPEALGPRRRGNAFGEGQA